MNFYVGVPVLNRYDLLIQSMMSVRAGTLRPAKFIIIDNGGRFPHFDCFREIDITIDVYGPGHNLGVAASWNKIMELAHPTPVVICNDDIVFAPDTMAAVMAESAPFVYLEHAGFGCFKLTHDCFREIGPFDEKFGSYHEDNDYHYRLRLAQKEIAVARHSGLVHLTGGSSTIKAMSKPERAAFDAMFSAGQKYYVQKWGSLPGQEIYARPFNTIEEAMQNPASVMLPLMHREKTWDKDIWLSVVQHNEYRLPEFLDRADAILDIGAHIGGFTQACLQRGAGHVYAVECDPSNFACLETNVRWWGNRTTLIQKAAWRSDDPNVAAVRMMVLDHANTGSTWLAGLDAASDASWGTPIAMTTEVVAFDELVSQVAAQHGSVAICKLDCEKSEWPILSTSKTLDKIKHLCGEYHPCRWDGRDWAKADLERILAEAGFTNIEVAEHVGDAQGLGLFFASR